MIAPSVSKRIRSVAVTALLFASPGLLAVVPDWALRLESRPNPTQVGAASAAILLDETSIDVSQQGVATTTRRIAIRILAEQGRGMADARVGYLQGTDKVRDASAWLLRKGKEVKTKAGNNWTDQSQQSGGTLYDEYRVKSIDCSDDAVAGDVFVSETVVAGQWLVPHRLFTWGWTLPVVEETLRVSMPPGFTLQALMRGSNPPARVDANEGRTATWIQRDQPYVKREAFEPDFDSNRPSLYFTVDPPAGSTLFKAAVLHSWTDVAHWIGALNTAQCDTSPELKQTAQKLTADCSDLSSKLRALGDYVQKIRYVAVNEGLGQGFGYKARKASDVFRNRYGDCKDKANLLVAMLREVGIEARTAAARSGDDRPVLAEFPSPLQFDHAICAIRVDESVDLPAVVVTERWGRMLFFDPTDSRTVLGDLPTRLQGTFVHVDDPLSDGLVALPHLASFEHHVFTRRANLQLDRNGTISGAASVLGRGQAGAQLRRSLFTATSEEKRRSFSAELLGDATRTAQLQKITPEDDTVAGVCGVTFELSKKNFVQFLPNAKAMARLEILSRGDLPTLPAPDRKFPIKVEPLAFADDIELILPDEFAVEELPTGASLTTAYGRYESVITVDGKKITLVRRLELKAQIVPAADYAKLKKFLSDIGKADRAAILLRTGA